MKFWTLIPILVEAAVAISPRDVYDQHAALARRGRSRNRLPRQGDFGEYWGYRSHGRCSQSTSSLKPTTVSAPPYTTVVVETTSTVPGTTYVAPTTTSKSTPPPETTPPPHTSTQSTSAAAPTTTSGGSGSGGTSSSDIAAYLAAHNTVRAQHGANPLVWNDTLATAGQTWANKCLWKHSGGTVGPYGENLAAGSGNMDISSAIAMWANEESSYNPANPQDSHYTQMVWKATTQLGCAVISCDLSAIASNLWPAMLYVCEYYPPGNVDGGYGENVS